MCPLLIIIWKHEGVLQILSLKQLKSYDENKLKCENVYSQENKEKSYKKEKGRI